MIKGNSFIGAREVTGTAKFTACEAATGNRLEPAFGEADAGHVDAACALAADAFDEFRELSPDQRAAFLEAIAQEIAGITDQLVDRAMAETGLPRPRLIGEVGRTTGQLRMFATYLREGQWIGAIIEPALPDRQPLPRPDLRQRRIPLGPVAVFGASNFPIAFSVAGGDTAAALAAGCPVVAKGHPAHPGTGELVARAIRAAVENAGLHEGVFSLLQGSSTALGGALVADPRIKAVGFTGSRSGGLALAAIAAARPEPIPVYAEMSSINPVVLFPGALGTRGVELAGGFVASLTLGAGQFCTNPGLVFAIAGQNLDQFIDAVAQNLGTAPAQVMLTSGISANYREAVARRELHHALTVVGRGARGDGATDASTVFVTNAAEFARNAALHEEVFGASAVIVRCADLAEIAMLLDRLEGQLTVTIQIDHSDEPVAATLMPVLEKKAGRVLANAWPTGVDVGRAMVHGGPYPATTDGRSTSVGTAAIERLLRPVCYQGIPDSLLPAALRAANPLGLPRLEV